MKIIVVSAKLPVPVGKMPLLVQVKNAVQENLGKYLIH